MSNRKKRDENATIEQQVLSLLNGRYRATTGLENAAGDRVEIGEELPAGFVPAGTLDHWLKGGDIVVIEPETEDQP